MHRNLKNKYTMDIFEKDLSGAMVSPDEPGYDKLISTIFDTMAATAEMNAKGWLTPEETAALKKKLRQQKRPVSVSF